jgi:hypothetical protein
MTISMPETSPENPSFVPAVPNFREDERIQVRYASMLQRRIKTHGVEHESSIRRNASTKRDELRDELDEANAEWTRRKEAADVAREAYRKAYPHHVKKTRLAQPSVLENVRSMGAANKLYHAAEEAWRAAESAASNIRRIEHNESQLEIELKKALERAPVLSKEVTESEEWLAEIHAEEELAVVKAKIDEIAAEREGYADRLAAGKVTPDELRLRAFAVEDVKHVSLPISGMMFYRVDQFGPNAYFIVRDLRKQLYALPYDGRLEKLLGGVYDISRAGKEFSVQPAMRDNGRAPLSLLDHFVKCSENAEAAQEAYNQHQEFIAQRRDFPTTSEGDEAEATAIRLLAEFAEAKKP